MTFDIYQMVTDKILAMLEKGTVPWHKPWNAGSVAPSNLISKKPYRGINSMLLAYVQMEENYPTGYWATFKQINQLGGRVISGEKATQIVYWNIVEKTVQIDSGEKDSEGAPIMVEKTDKHYFLRYYNVFNVAQTIGLEAHVPAVIVRENGVIERAEKIVAGYVNGPAIQLGGSEACYAPFSDRVNVPVMSAFENSELFYSALFHELVHSTGHATRLDRFSEKDYEGGFFGNEPYSREELVAELGACFLCARVGIEQMTITESAGYIEHWIGKLKNDRKLIVVAAGAAQRAVDHIAPVEVEGEGEGAPEGAQAPEGERAGA